MLFFMKMQRLKKLKLKNSYLLFDADVPCELRNDERFISTNIFMFNNSQIDEVDESKCTAKAILVADTEEPQIKQLNNKREGCTCLYTERSTI